MGEGENVLPVKGVLAFYVCCINWPIGTGMPKTGD
jgi:hypothetical protein